MQAAGSYFPLFLVSAPVVEVGSVACVGFLVEGTGACVLVGGAGSCLMGRGTSNGAFWGVCALSMI